MGVQLDVPFNCFCTLLKINWIYSCESTSVPAMLFHSSVYLSHQDHSLDYCSYKINLNLDFSHLTLKKNCSSSFAFSINFWMIFHLPKKNILLLKLSIWGELTHLLYWVFWPMNGFSLHLLSFFFFLNQHFIVPTKVLYTVLRFTPSKSLSHFL